MPREINDDVSGGRNICDVSRQLSQPFGLHHLSDGRFAAFHVDARIIDNNVFGRVFMTVISATTASSAPTSAEPRSAVALSRSVSGPDRFAVPRRVLPIQLGVAAAIQREGHFDTLALIHRDRAAQ